MGSPTEGVPEHTDLLCNEANFTAAISFAMEHAEYDEMAEGGLPASDVESDSAASLDARELDDLDRIIQVDAESLGACDVVAPSIHSYPALIRQTLQAIRDNNHWSEAKLNRKATGDIRHELAHFAVFLCCGYRPEDIQAKASFYCIEDRHGVFHIEAFFEILPLVPVRKIEYAAALLAPKQPSISDKRRVVDMGYISKGDVFDRFFDYRRQGVL